ncbi:MAG: low molecular weight protein-tyrosine-phosphatase [Candidatus Competibacteraceae bacterium]
MLTKVLFVCMGNVCRSPMAEGTLRRMLEETGLGDKIVVASAGTHTFHLGAAPDMRGQIVAGRRGVSLKGIRARRLAEDDFSAFDYLLAMDQENYSYLHDLCPQSEHREKIQLFLSYAPHLADREIPDPYYGSQVGFERVMDLLEAGAEGFLLHLRERYRL